MTITYLICSSEWKKKVDVVDIESEDAVEYNPVDTFIFEKDRSSPLTGNEIVTIPNPLIVVSYYEQSKLHDYDYLRLRFIKLTEKGKITTK